MAENRPSEVIQARQVHAAVCNDCCAIHCWMRYIAGSESISLAVHGRAHAACGVRHTYHHCSRCTHDSSIIPGAGPCLVEGSSSQQQGDTHLTAMAQHSRGRML